MEENVLGEAYFPRTGPSTCSVLPLGRVLLEPSIPGTWVCRERAKVYSQTQLQTHNHAHSDGLAACRTAPRALGTQTCGGRSHDQGSEASGQKLPTPLKGCEYSSVEGEGRSVVLSPRGGCQISVTRPLVNGSCSESVLSSISR